MPQTHAALFLTTLDLYLRDTVQYIFYKNVQISTYKCTIFVSTSPSQIYGTTVIDVADQGANLTPYSESLVSCI